jgi:acetolactate synthase-1/2/3 large subunit
MAVVCGELTGSCGACISIMGTGAINLAGGATYAFLERHPLLCITETYGLSGAPLMSMQKIDHGATFAPYCKDVITLGADDPGRQIDRAIRLAMAERPGPIHVDYPQSMDGSHPGRVVDSSSESASRPQGDLEAIANEIDRAEKPIIIAGPVVLRQHAQDDLLRLAERLQCAVMVTSKARGVIPEDHPLYAGIISGVYGKDTLEGRMVYKSDTVLAVGLDRMELLTPWKFPQPLLALDAIPVSPDDAVGEPSLTASGPLPMLLDSLTNTVRQRRTWQASELQDFWDQAMNDLGAESADLNATNALVHARRMSPRDAIVTTEAGVYGRVNLYAWKVYGPGTYFDSSGANTMGFSIPAGMAASLVRPQQKAVSLVGDGGFLMRAGELETAARLGLAPVIVIFDDGTLGMIRVKQRARGYAREGVDLTQTDFVRLAESFGGVGWEVRTLEEFDTAFKAALESDRLSVIDVRVDPEGYLAHVTPIRGI